MSSTIRYEKILIYLYYNTTILGNCKIKERRVMASLVKIEKQTMLKSVIYALREYIIASKLQPGDRLPSEHELSEKLGASRNVIREAMRYYRTLGIITSKPKIGAVIANISPTNPFEGHIPFMKNDPETLRDVVDMRMALECGSAPLMIAGVTDEDIDRLEELLKDLKGSSLTDAEIEFHSSLLRMTQNRLIESIIPLTIEFFHTKECMAINQSAESIEEQHKLIIDALRQRSVVKLSDALQHHYKSYYQGETSK
jgi:DNA-binding FadR family transcriptional regulator